MNYMNGYYFGWAWILWLGFLFLLFSSFGNWGYAYSAHQKYDLPRKGARDILDERLARGEVTREQYAELKSDLAST